MEQKLTQLETELSRIRNKEAYNAAKIMDQDYVENRDFRLLFLRADRFNAKKAALRMARHFQAKSDLFGRDKIARDIVQSDLEKEDLECLYAGYEQFLPSKDRAGRDVFMQLAHANNKRMNVTSKLRRFYYLVCQRMRDDVEAQKKGTVAVFFMGGNFLSNSYNIGERIKYPMLSLSLPVRFDAVHLCYDSKVWRTMIHLSKLLVGARLRNRIREHCCKLLTFQEKVCFLSNSS